MNQELRTLNRTTTRAWLPWVRVAMGACAFVALAVPIIVSAESATNVPGDTTLVNPIGGTAQNPEGVSDVPALLGNVLRALFGVLGSIALLMFIYGGFTWLTSGGVPEKIKKGQDTMVWATLGIAIVFAAYAIVNFVINALTGGT